MMPEWLQLDSSSTISEQQESAKKKTLKSSSRSFWFSTGLESFPFVKQLTQVAGLIEDHLDLSTGLKKHLPSQVFA